MKFDEIIDNEDIHLDKISKDILMNIQNQRLKRSIEIDFRDSVKFKEFMEYLKQEFTGIAWKVTTPLAERLAIYIIILYREKRLVPEYEDGELVSYQFL